MNNILLINCSSKKKGGASAFFSKLLSLMLFPRKVTTRTIGTSRNFENIFADMKSAGVVVLSVPLYVDTIPSHMIYFLQQMERRCKESKPEFMLYVISNSGYVGGKDHNKLHLEQYMCWCERAGVTWGGGLGIGGGVMLHVIFYVIFLLNIAQFIVGALINAALGKPPVDAGLVMGFARRLALWLVFSSGMFFSEFMLARAIKKQRAVENKYTRVMVPSFIYLLFADLYMLVLALLHGKTIFSLYKKIDYKKNAPRKAADIAKEGGPGAGQDIRGPRQEPAAPRMARR
jgi:hypothetical protein